MAKHIPQRIVKIHEKLGKIYLHHIGGLMGAYSQYHWDGADFPSKLSAQMYLEHSGLDKKGWKLEPKK